MRSIKAILALGVAACLLASGVQAGEKDFNEVLNVGDAAPAIKNLKSTDGKDIAFNDVKGQKGTVVVFTCNQCPVAKAYEGRLNDLTQKYQAKGINLVAINCNGTASDSLENMKKRATEQGFNFSYVKDPTEQSGKDFGAKVTPEVFLINGAGKVVYMGAIDDSWKNADKVQNAYLATAIDALLADSQVATAATKATGCGIKYSKK